MGYLKRRLIQWIAINLVGMTAYLWMASALWIRLGEEGTPGGPGDAFYSLFILVPIIVVFIAINLTVLVPVLREAVRNHRFWPFMAWLIMIALWAALLAFDRYKSFTVIDPAYV
jgi:small-conductance mechanosensitive channel